MTREQMLNEMERMLDAATHENRLFTSAEDARFEELKAACGGKPRSTKKMTTKPQLRVIKDRSDDKLTIKHFIADACHHNPENLDLGQVAEVKQEIGHIRGSALQHGYLPYSVLYPQKALAPGGTLPGDAFEVLPGYESLEELGIGAAIIPPPVFANLPIRRMVSSEPLVKDFQVGDKVTAQWIPRDGALTVANAPLFTEKNIVPFTQGALVRLLRSSMYSPSGVEYTRMSIANSLQVGIEAAMIAATNVTNAPDSILNQATASSVAASIPVDATAGQELVNVTQDFLNYVYETQGNSSGQWLIHDGALQQYALLPRSAPLTGYPLYGENFNGGLVGFPVQSCRTLPVTAGTPNTAQALFGDFSSIVFCAFGAGVELVGNPFSQGDFEAGALQLRAIGDFSWSVRDQLRLYSFDTDLSA